MAPPATDSHTLMRFLARLGQAELAAGNAVALVERDLGLIARRYGREDILVFALPTVLMVQSDEGQEHRVQITPGPYRSGELRFDQMEGVLEIAREARSGKLPPHDGLRRLDAVWRMKHRYGDAGFVLGYLLATIGIALILRPTWAGLGYVAGLGLACALLLVAVRRQPVWNAVMPVVAAFLLASSVAMLYRFGVQEPALHLLIPPLIIFLPGSTLAVSVVELAFANIVSGAARFVAGAMQLVLLAFGLLGGFRAFGGAFPVAVEGSYRLAPWLSWAGVLIFAVGLHLFKSSRPRSLPWMIATMAMAFLGQVAAGKFLDGSATAFAGAVVMTITALVIEYRLKGPPALVSIIPAFWLLAPGAFGLASVATMASGGLDAAGSLLDLLFILTAIATGCLIGAFVYSGLLHVRRARWWRGELFARGGTVADDQQEGTL
ncbi:MAG: threonine/serine exporter family protein [Flavobacteriales bacterium]|nr:threonine/serine exporter family protein [Flavobacteriales bacterium]MBP9080363.1 threonine/serine exporter family protein [Flavobacteriales bacterium]